MHLPSLTIITITFNNLEGLKSTLKSVSEQQNKNFEHWVIDGGSTDGTLEYLETYQKHPIQFISEPDKGIYDAMNKGIERARGSWTIFMNAGDFFAQSDVLSKVVFSEHLAVIYGNSRINYEGGFERLMIAGETQHLWKGMSFTHQATFLKTSLIKERKYDLNYKYCADFNQIFGMYLEGLKFAKTTIIIAQIEAGGISDSERYKATAEVYSINRKLNPEATIHLYFVTKIVWGFISVKFKSILPQKWKNKLLERKYKKSKK